MLADRVERRRRKLTHKAIRQLLKRAYHDLAIACTRQRPSNVPQRAVLPPALLGRHRAPDQAQQRALLLDRLARIVNRADGIVGNPLAQFGNSSIQLLAAATHNRRAYRLISQELVGHDVSSLQPPLPHLPDRPAAQSPGRTALT